jgi:REP element-mobilizing transposase RayT
MQRCYCTIFPAKYRRVIFDEAVEMVLMGVCREIEKRYEPKFLEIGTDKDHVHFLVQSVTVYSVTKLVKMIKAWIIFMLFNQCPGLLRYARDDEGSIFVAVVNFFVVTKLALRLC